MRGKLILLILAILLFSSSSISVAESVNHSEEGHREIVEVVYFYGAGCPHCEKLEDFLGEMGEKYDLNVQGYEVYINRTNRELATRLAEEYGDSFRGVPITFIGDKLFMGFSDSIGREIESKIKLCLGNCCDNPLEKVGYCKEEEYQKEKLTFASVITLAVADSVNPCALAVLTMALVALLVRDPRKKKSVIYGGLAFTFAVFVTYIFYGLVIIQFFKVIAVYFVAISKVVRVIFASLAILLGLMNVKDFFKYTPGTIGTEMPMFMRPIAKSLIKNITRPRGAFIIGIVVTLFLLPCTIGPYLVVGNILSAFDLMKLAPWLLLYNIIFVLPMIGITFFVYFGYTTVEKVSGWKEGNIKYMHLAAGIVLLLLGLAMILGYI
ncbi:hypothetical protein GOV06_04315 [Candidatus Woesearchaeota archaeon]|nr:hypothetical protein [Candidatus Woesearchaeota archaeon]